MGKRDVIIGFILGLLANVLGITLYIVLFSKDGFTDTIKNAISNEFLGKLVSLGAVVNLLVFFYFIKKHEDHKARGVLMATLMAAIIVIINKV